MPGVAIARSRNRRHNQRGQHDDARENPLPIHSHPPFGRDRPKSCANYSKVGKERKRSMAVQPAPDRYLDLRSEKSDRSPP